MVFLGDSITAGYGLSPDQAFPALVEKLVNKSDTLISAKAAGISGSTAASGPDRMKWLLKSQPDVVVIELGANDGLRGQSIANMVASLQRTIRIAKDAGVKVLLVGMKLPGNYGGKYGIEFSEAFPKLAKQENVAFLPFFFDQIKKSPKSLLLPDGLHPNAEGHIEIAARVAKSLQALL